MLCSGDEKAIVQMLYSVLMILIYLIIIRYIN